MLAEIFGCVLIIIVALVLLSLLKPPKTLVHLHGELPVNLSRRVRLQYLTPPKEKATRDIKIPRIIHQTHASIEVPTRMAQAAQKWIDTNPTWTHKYYDDASIDAYIKKHTDDKTYEALKILEAMYPEKGAMRADLFRLVVMEREGGVYADMDTEPKVPLDEIIHSDDEYVSGVGKRKDFHQWLLIATPHHPFIKTALEESIYAIFTDTPLGGGISKEAGYAGPPMLDHSVNLALARAGKIKQITGGSYNIPSLNTSYRVIDGDYLGGQVNFKYRGYDNDMKEMGLVHWSKNKPVPQNLMALIQTNVRAILLNSYGYRLSDLLNGKVASEKRFVNKFPGSFAYHIINNSDGKEEFSLLKRLVDEKDISRSPMSSEAVIHLRIGDTIDMHNEIKAKDFFENQSFGRRNKKQILYVLDKTYYKDVLSRLEKVKNIQKVVLVYQGALGTASQHSKPKSNSLNYVESVANIFRDKYEVEHYSSGNADEDLSFLARAQTFIPGGGGYSSLATALNIARGNKPILQERLKIEMKRLANCNKNKASFICPYL